MSFPKPALFSGTVLHRRVFPKWHSLRYRAFSVLLDLDHIGSFANSCRLFSHNRWNILSIHDRDHADGETPDLAWFVRDIVRRRLDLRAERVLMFTFPRVLGYVFNPLTVYFCLGKSGEVSAIVYEVNNTFGGRVHYACKVTDADGQVSVDGASKRLLVSPFNGERGRYGFKLDFDDEKVVIGVSLKEAGRPIINTSYATSSVSATDTNIARLVTTMPFMTLKVMIAIHIEALKLWLKGLRPPAPLRNANKACSAGILGGAGPTRIDTVGH
ncbi:MAG: DUF1365 domain-containing protein [Rhizobiaceae bacterium]